jgi:hypothetical protein
MVKISNKDIAELEEARKRDEREIKSLTRGSKPSAFSSFPYSSIFGECNCEVIAQNIMVILKRTGNAFRLLTWKEYSKERKQDGNFNTREERFFNKVVESCSTEAGARKFSKEWREVK